MSILDLDLGSVLNLDLDLDSNFLVPPPELTVNLSQKENLGISGSMSADKGTQYAKFKCIGPSENPTKLKED